MQDNIDSYVFCVTVHRCRNRGARGARAPQYFTLETLLMFIHAAQIAVSQCILRLPPQNGIVSYAYVVDRAGRASMVGHHPGNLSEVALVSSNGSINPVHVANRRGGM